MPSATAIRFRLCEFRFGLDRPSHLRAGEHDIGADNDPKGVLADDRDGDEDANNPNNCHHERGDKSKTHLHPGLLTRCPRAAHIPPVNAYHGRCCIRPTRINSKRPCCIDFFTPGAHAMASLIVASSCRSARRTLVDRSLPLWRSGLPDIPVARVSGAIGRDPDHHRQKNPRPRIWQAGAVDHASTWPQRGTDAARQLYLWFVTSGSLCESRL
jgi:hypothetical protein